MGCYWWSSGCCCSGMAQSLELFCSWSSDLGVCCSLRGRRGDAGGFVLWDLCPRALSSSHRRFLRRRCGAAEVCGRPGFVTGFVVGCFFLLPWRLAPWRWRVSSAAPAVCLGRWTKAARGLAGLVQRSIFCHWWADGSCGFQIVSRFSPGLVRWWLGVVFSGDDGGVGDLLCCVSCVRLFACVWVLVLWFL